MKFEVVVEREVVQEATLVIEAEDSTDAWLKAEEVMKTEAPDWESMILGTPKRLTVQRAG